MDLLTLILKVRDLIAALRTNDWRTVITLVFEIGRALAETWGTNGPPPIPAMAPGAPSMSAQIAALSSDTDDIADELENVISQQPTPTGAAASAPAQGPLLDALKPLLFKLLLMWLGIG